MDAPDLQIFIALFQQACLRCFGQLPATPLDAAASAHMSHVVHQSTGLFLSTRIIQHYAAFALAQETAITETPSGASLDTLARYVMDAPYTTEAERKTREGYFPYWHLFKAQYTTGTANEVEDNPVPARTVTSEPDSTGAQRIRRRALAVGIVLIVVVLLALALFQ